ncbi:MAG: hypothetical protein AVDCRST_MAG53-3510 [uncultured Solirubrobacteraceae bacterium]|uniref:Uncharacterized protein n=1 Tax=uncultured Solirubrobacteraceae bacterium TaxID=1162706 RepID=A0A6J4TFB5_9ACTN|nr:MAG: hypothetical protein AVDCRST_MAG53-3510 [uncultured Solirubrobacteraceae bacterium]
MTSLEPRSPKRVSRKDREARAFRLAAAGGTFGVIAVVGLVLAIVGGFGLGIPVLSGIIAVICLVLFRRTVGM